MPCRSFGRTGTTAGPGSPARAWAICRYSADPSRPGDRSATGQVGSLRPQVEPCTPGETPRLAVASRVQTFARRQCERCLVQCGVTEMPADVQPARTNGGMRGARLPGWRLLTHRD